MTFAAGRQKTGGRVAGTANHATVAHRTAILKSGLSPIDYLTAVFRNPDEPTSVRVSAAQTVCSYIYPKLSAIDVNAHSGDQPMVVQLVRFSDLSLADQRAPTIDVIPDDAGAIADGAEPGEADAA